MCTQKLIMIYEWFKETATNKITENKYTLKVCQCDFTLTAYMATNLRVTCSDYGDQNAI